MDNKRIIKSLRNKKQKLIDEKGFLSKRIGMKRLEKYANEMDMVLTRYNKKSCNTTMMIKGYRKSEQESTNRKTHQEELELIVGQMSKGLGLYERISKTMGKHHDIRHTFEGHSGEWWISNILEDYGLGYFGHPTLGASDLIYTHKVYDEIVEKIKVHNPQITQNEIRRVRKSLWLIMDAINAHNGEKPDKEFVPDSKKSEQDFSEEMIKCYSISGYDRKIIPATSEACLMRLADKIAYTPLDMVDGIREGLVRDEDGKIIDYLDDDYKAILKKFGITDKEIEEANIKKKYDTITEKLKSILINDVIQNSTKKRIRMSKDKMQFMGELLNLNNKKAVDNVILIEDQETYPPAIRTLINQFKGIILENDLLPVLSGANQNLDINEQLHKYKGTPYQSFITYICNMNEDDFNFTQSIVENATRETVREELVTARTNIEQGIKYKDKEELGLDYSNKNYRIKGYMAYYRKKLESGELIGYDETDLNEETNKVINYIKGANNNSRFLNMQERMALIIGARYIATLNDIEFMQLLQDTGIISKEKYKSLTRKYKDIANLKDEVYVQSNWKDITKMQQRAVDNQKDK